MFDERVANKLYTVSEIMESASVTRPTVHDWIKTGKLVAVRVGKEYRITQEQYDDFLERHVVSNSPKKRR